MGEERAAGQLPEMPTQAGDVPVQPQLLLLVGEDRSFRYNTTRPMAFFYGLVCRNRLISN